MNTSFWVRCAALGATVTLLGAGCTTSTTTDTTITPVPTDTSGTITTDTTVEGEGEGNVDVDTDTDVSLTATVTLSGDGFSPATLNVKKGTVVTFINKGSTAHWPASDPHPTHTDYPEFDPKHEIKSGESWTFTFDKVGSWRYHDHLNSGEKGVIIVTE